MSDIILTATTSAANSSTFQLSARDQIALATTGTDTAAEYADIQYSSDGGSTWKDLYQDGTQVRLHSTNNMVTVEGPGIFRVAKEATTNAIGIIRFGG